MQTFKLHSTKQIRELFPDLQRTNKFKRALDRLFAAITPDITFQIADPWKCFTAKDGKRYKYRVMDASGRGYCLGRTKVERSFVNIKDTLEAPEKYRDVQPFRGTTLTTPGGERQELVEAKVETTRGLGWGDFVLYIGKLLKDEKVFVQSCNKCEGTGFIPEFAHISEGVCFQCMGIGKWLEVKNESAQV